TVITVCQTYDNRGTVVTPSRPGRPEKLTCRDKRVIRRELMRNRRAPLAEITANLATPVCVNTARSAVHKLGFGNRVAPKKPYLKDKHKADRLAFARAHLSWSAEDWGRIIWTDESSFEIGKLSRQVRVWRRVYEKYDWDCLA